MSLVFLAFANQKDAPLPTLQQEDDKVYAAFARREQQQHLRIHRDSYTTRRKIGEYLNMHKDELVIFHYSGHAERDRLLLEDETADSRGIAAFLAQCPRLKLVMLNGCSTFDQVATLAALPSHPVVIGTHAPVSDKTATEFSIQFYQALCENRQTIEEAFAAGLAAAQTASDKKIESARGLSTRDMQESNTPLWAMVSDSQTNLGWKLPDRSPAAAASDQPEPNTFLIEHLIECLAPIQPSIAPLTGDKAGLVDKRSAILTCLPHPISEQVRKLIVPPEPDSKHQFFFTPSRQRLEQITVAYNTIIELIAFSQLAQLWELMSENGNDSLKISPEQSKVIKQLLSLDRDKRDTYSFLPLIRTLSAIFSANKLSYFLEELETVQAEFAEGTDFSRACTSLEDFRSRLSKLSDQEAVGLCADAEKKLATVMGALAAISKYTLASVKDIGVLKFRHRKKMSYRHKIVRLIQRFVGLEEAETTLEEAMMTSSVLLLKGEGNDIAYLNLSPFIIDENAFDAKAPLTGLFYFERYEKALDSYAFKYVYKPQDFPLTIQKQDHFRVIKEQFDDFARLLFNRPMRSL